MSLVKSPVLTPAKIAANRANSSRSTGPRTARGKQAVILNRIGRGRRSPAALQTVGRALLRQQLEVARIYADLYYALGPKPDELDWVERVAAHVWWMKREMERALRDPRFKPDVEAHGGWLPQPYRLRFERPGWRVTVSVRSRRDRGRTGRQTYPLGWWDGKRPLHVQVVVRCSFGRAWRPGNGRRWKVRASLARKRNVTWGAFIRATFKARISNILNNFFGCLSRKPAADSGGGRDGPDNGPAKGN